MKCSLAKIFFGGGVLNFYPLNESNHRSLKFYPYNPRIISLLNPKTENLIMSLRSDIVSFWFCGYRGDIKIELQAPVLWSNMQHLATPGQSCNLKLNQLFCSTSQASNTRLSHMIHKHTLKSLCQVSSVLRKHPS